MEHDRHQVLDENKTTEECTNIEARMKNSNPEDFYFEKPELDKSNTKIDTLNENTKLNPEDDIIETTVVAEVLNGDQITSSPMITFGQETMNMITEFMNNEKKEKKKSIWDIFKCCK